MSFVETGRADGGLNGQGSVPVPVAWHCRFPHTSGPIKHFCFFLLAVDENGRRPLPWKGEIDEHGGLGNPVAGWAGGRGASLILAASAILSRNPLPRLQCCTHDPKLCREPNSQVWWRNNKQQRAARFGQAGDARKHGNLSAHLDSDHSEPLGQPPLGGRCRDTRCSRSEDSVAASHAAAWQGIFFLSACGRWCPRSRGVPAPFPCSVLAALR